jgi:peroxiredoxin
LLLNRNRSYYKSVKQVRIEVGLPAPDFTFPGINGKMVSLSDYRGKVVPVNIWATWCPSCVDEMPSMEKLSIQTDKTSLSDTVKQKNL